MDGSIHQNNFLLVTTQPTYAAPYTIPFREANPSHHDLHCFIRALKRYLLRGLLSLNRGNIFVLISQCKILLH